MDINKLITELEKTCPQQMSELIKTTYGSGMEDTVRDLATGYADRLEKIVTSLRRVAEPKRETKKEGSGFVNPLYREDK